MQIVGDQYKYLLDIYYSNNYYSSRRKAFDSFKNQIRVNKGYEVNTHFLPNELTRVEYKIMVSTDHSEAKKEISIRVIITKIKVQ